MPVPRIDPATLRLVTSSTTHPAASGFSVGDRVVARVVERLAGGEIVLDFGVRQLVARPAVPLAPGQSLHLEVVRTSPEIELRLLQGSARFSERAFAEAVLGQARREVPPGDGAALWRAVSSLPAGRLAATGPLVDLARQVASVAGPIDGAAEAGVLALAVRRFLEQGGLIFETRLRGSLDSTGTASPAGTHPTLLPPSLSGDLKVLLAALGRALQASSSTPEGPPGAAIAGQRATAEGRASPAGAAALDLVGREHGRLVEQVLARQVNVAYHWVKDGALRLDLPFELPFGPSMAHLSVSRDRGPSDEDAGAPAFLVDLTFSIGPLGQLGASARWHGDHLALQVFVEHEAARAVVEPQVPGLVAGLRASGFREVTSALAVDPARVRRREPDPGDLPPGGGVFSARV